MNLSYEVLNVLIFLIPGFLSAVIYNAVIVRKDKDVFSKIIEALIYSLISYVIASVIAKKSAFILTISTVNNVKRYGLNLENECLITVLLISIVLPLFLGWLNTQNILMKGFHKIGITKKTARDSTWLDVFTDVNKYIIVTLKDGRRVYGWPSYYSNEATEGMLFLSEPAWIENGEYVDLNIEGLFLVERDNIDYIEFLDYPQSKRKVSIWEKMRTKSQTKVGTQGQQKVESKSEVLISQDQLK